MSVTKSYNIHVLFSLHFKVPLPSTSLLSIRLSEPYSSTLLFHSSLGSTVSSEKPAIFSHKLHLSYKFQVEQTLKISLSLPVSQTISPSLDILESADTSQTKPIACTLGWILGSPGQKNKLKLETVQNEHLADVILTCSSLNIDSRFVIFKFSGEKLKKPSFFGSHNPFLTVRLQSAGPDCTLFRTEIAAGIQNPQWKSFELSLPLLNKGDLSKMITISAYNLIKPNGECKLIGAVNTSLNEMATKQIFDLTKPNKTKVRGKLILNELHIYNKYDFLEYIRGGLSLNLILGVDFTSSKGNSNESSTLHSIKNIGQLSDYQLAILTLSNLLLEYTSESKVATFGFGGKPSFSRDSIEEGQLCFPLSGNASDPYLYGIYGVSGAYTKAISGVHVCTPTMISLVIDEANKLAMKSREMGNNEYNVLVILTDGDLHDLEKANDCIQTSACLPLSIVIVGMIKKFFGNLERLSKTNEDLVRNGKRTRDCLKFVLFEQFKANENDLRKEVLDKVPEQVQEYMRGCGKKPMEFMAIKDEELEYVEENEFSLKTRKKNKVKIVEEAKSKESGERERWKSMFLGGTGQQKKVNDNHENGHKRRATTNHEEVKTVSKGENHEIASRVDGKEKVEARNIEEKVKIKNDVTKMINGTKNLQAGDSLNSWELEAKNYHDEKTVKSSGQESHEVSDSGNCKEEKIIIKDEIVIKSNSGRDSQKSQRRFSDHVERMNQLYKNFDKTELQFETLTEKVAREIE